LKKADNYRTCNIAAVDTDNWILKEAKNDKNYKISLFSSGIFQIYHLNFIEEVLICEGFRAQKDSCLYNNGDYTLER